MRVLSKLAFVFALLFVLQQFASDVFGQIVATPKVNTADKNPKAEKESATEKDTKADSKENKKLSDFTRIRKDADGNPTAFETSIVRYTGTNKAGEAITVDLVGAVHIGDQKYYESLNEEFKQYESLLYELVAPKGTKIKKGRKGGFSVIAAMQGGMKDVLGLVHQLEYIDYNAKNFIHADMTPKEFSESRKKNEESTMRTFFKMLGHGMAAQGSSGAPSNTKVLEAMLAKDGGIKLRRIFALQIQTGDTMMTAFDGKDGSTIITHRNKKALSVLKTEMDGGKKNIGIFYGAAHFPDMEERLIKEFGLKRVSEKWLCAWNLNEKKLAEKPKK